MVFLRHDILVRLACWSEILIFLFFRMEENTTPSSDSQTKPAGSASKIVGGVALVALLGAVVAWFLGKPTENAMAPADDAGAMKKTDDVMEKAEDATTMESQEDDASMAPQEGAMMENLYKDGTYSASGAYTSPAGSENVEVTLTLKDGSVTNVVFKGDAENEKSKFMQEKFGEGISAQVVGKSIDSLDLAVVNGSSLTPKGFMDALEKIKQEAKG